MSHLVLILHLFIGATLAGVGIVVLLVAGLGGAWALAAAVAVGFVAAFPIARAVARAIGGE
ncbi:CTP synthetase [Antarcticimicrobium luteum]|uniref:CTP synthetase n=1 Tax=Antarcticimicrobium luteum TaxID=2547397 RepID=A0A4R5UT67_9RHOB|nr:CTP synthetase [Antarcticimicrobium luteum]TDK42186.1 CTP synthetase [Antarcticimicrobium luteum]